MLVSGLSIRMGKSLIYPTVSGAVSLTISRNTLSHTKDAFATSPPALPACGRRSRFEFLLVLVLYENAS